MEFIVRPPQQILFSGCIDDLEGLFEFAVVEDAKDVLAWSVDVFAQQEVSKAVSDKIVVRLCVIFADFS